MRISVGTSKSAANTAVFSPANSAPAMPAIAAPNENAISFNRFTGMPMSSAASESSRSDFQARPVRDASTR